MSVENDDENIHYHSFDSLNSYSENSEDRSNSSITHRMSTRFFCIKCKITLNQNSFICLKCSSRFCFKCHYETNIEKQKCLKCRKHIKFIIYEKKSGQIDATKVSCQNILSGCSSIYNITKIIHHQKNCWRSKQSKGKLSEGKIFPKVNLKRNINLPNAKLKKEENY